MEARAQRQSPREQMQLEPLPLEPLRQVPRKTQVVLARCTPRGGTGATFAASVMAGIAGAKAISVVEGAGAAQVSVPWKTFAAVVTRGFWASSILPHGFVVSNTFTAGRKRRYQSGYSWKWRDVLVKVLK